VLSVIRGEINRTIFAFAILLSACARPPQGLVTEVLGDTTTDGGAMIVTPHTATSCPPSHADCDNNDANGCEADLSSTASCGACGRACAGGSLCKADGHGSFACSSSCATGTSACGNQCIDLTSSLDHCGDCNRACATANTSASVCQTGVCKPTCAHGFADCSHPSAPAADDGCETDAQNDRGEPDDTCGTVVLDVNENATLTRNARMLTVDDADTITVNFHEDQSKFCFLFPQFYTTKIILTSPTGASHKLRYNTTTACGANDWQDHDGATPLCLYWDGACETIDDVTASFQVVSGGAPSCEEYTLSVQYCAEGDNCGCP
jgi:hypothetical protein